MYLREWRSFAGLISLVRESSISMSDRRFTEVGLGLVNLRRTGLSGYRKVVRIEKLQVFLKFICFIYKLVIVTEKYKLGTRSSYHSDVDTFAVDFRV